MRWTARPISDPGAVSQLTAEVTKDPLLAALLVQRGITTFEDAKAFFRPDLNLLHHPYRMKDMERAVERRPKSASIALFQKRQAALSSKSRKIPIGIIG